jgi:ABC-type transport system involved in multi-copper enzyme maturation permease subunit
MEAQALTENVTSNRFTQSAERIFVVARNTSREVLRQRLLPFTMLFAMVLMVGLSRLRELTFGASELRFIVDVGFGAIDLFGSVLTIALTAQLFFNELEHRTLFTLLAKPVSRGEFLLGKFFGVGQAIALFSAVLGAVLGVVLWLRAGALIRANDAADAASFASIDYTALGASIVAQTLKLWVVAATTLLVASFARTQLFTLATSFLLCVIGHLQEFAQAAAMHSSTIGGKFALKLTLLFSPNFRVFDFSDAVTGERVFTIREWLRVEAYGAAYVALFLAGALWCFRKREL